MEHKIIYNKTRERYEAYEDGILAGFLDVEIRNNSIRINDQYRLCFYWNNGNVIIEEIGDYH